MGPCKRGRATSPSIWAAGSTSSRSSTSASNLPTSCARADVWFSRRGRRGGSSVARTRLSWRAIDRLPSISVLALRDPKRRRRSTSRSSPCGPRRRGGALGPGRELARCLQPTSTSTATPTIAILSPTPMAMTRIGLSGLPRRGAAGGASRRMTWTSGAKPRWPFTFARWPPQERPDPGRSRSAPRRRLQGRAGDRAGAAPLTPPVRKNVRSRAPPPRILGRGSRGAAVLRRGVRGAAPGTAAR